MPDALLTSVKFRRHCCETASSAWAELEARNAVAVLAFSPGPQDLLMAWKILQMATNRIETAIVIVIEPDSAR